MGCSCFPFGFSGAAAGVSPGKQLMNTGSIPFPKQQIATSSLNGVHSHCRNVIMKGGNGTGEAERNFPPSGNRNYKHRGLMPSSKPERGPCAAGAAAHGAVRQATLSSQPCPPPVSPGCVPSYWAQRVPILSCRHSQLFLYCVKRLCQDMEAPPNTLPAPRCPFSPVASS